MTDIFDQGDQLQKDSNTLQSKNNKGKSNKKNNKKTILLIYNSGNFTRFFKKMYNGIFDKDKTRIPFHHLEGVTNLEDRT